MAYIVKDAEGKEVIHQGKQLFGSDRIGVVKTIDPEKRTLVIVGTDETKDRDGDIISVSGWQMENFMKNPVFLYAHDHWGVPIGAASKVVRRKNPARLEFHEKFPSKGLYPFADMILELFNERILNASSVGFIPLEWENLDENNPYFGGRKFIKQELLELSACPVPSNPAALQTENFAKMFKNVESLKEALSPKNKDDILEELVIRNIDIEDELRPLLIQVGDVEHETDTTDKQEEFTTVKGEFENKKKMEDPLIPAPAPVIEEIPEPVEIKNIEEDDMEIKEMKELFETLLTSNISMIEMLKEIKEMLTSKLPEIPIEELNQEEDLHKEILSQEDNKDQKTEEAVSAEKIAESELQPVIDSLKEILSSLKTKEE